jgi:hypothetical protein
MSYYRAAFDGDSVPEKNIATKLRDWADCDVREAGRDALLGQHPEQRDYQNWAELMVQAADRIEQLEAALEMLSQEHKRVDELRIAAEHRVRVLEARNHANYGTAQNSLMPDREGDA